ncbi:transposase [Deinococcus humi]|uniref:Transposase n=1 Tax=Deinococcus humi TaxID=662880 RepID=A0A7W8JYY4_9DEIO|nr:transposase [Deinococcus humi]
MRRSYPSEGDDDTSLFLLPSLLLSPEAAIQRRYAIRETLNALLWVTRTGAQWASLPHDFPPAETVRQQAQRWLQAGCFENAAHDPRRLCCLNQFRGG